jgi:predicted RNase H-like HicB family nuclease
MDEQNTMTLEEYVNRPYKTQVIQDNCNSHPCYVAYHPELPGCMAQGETWQDAVKSLDEARRDYIRVLLKEGWEVPVPEYQPSHRAHRFQLIEETNPLIDRPVGQQEDRFQLREVPTEQVAKQLSAA